MNAVITTPQTERITLYYREGSSDKRSTRVSQQRVGM
jgi:hypothetical protein